LSEFEKKVAAFITASSLFDTNEPVLLAVSGGADSVALLFAMLALARTGAIDARLVIGHVNHRLRGPSSDEDQDFVAALGKKLGLKVVARSVDVRSFAIENKLSIETAARKLRIRTLIDIANRNGCKKVATAHHKDDNAETMIHRLLRGTGFRGLVGISPKRAFSDGVTFVRPMLCVLREEIIEYCKTNNLQWRYDLTNADIGYTRNRIRHLLLPHLQRGCNGSLVEYLAQLSQNCRNLHSRLCRQVEKVWPVVVPDLQPDTVTLDAKILCAQTQIVQAELVRRTLVALGSGERDLKEVHYSSIMQLAKGPAGRIVELPGPFLAQARYDKIILCRATKAKVPDPFLGGRTDLQIPGLTQFETCSIEASVLDAKNCNIDRFKSAKDRNVEWFDYDKLAHPVVVRHRQAGDRFWPLGGVGEKKIGKFLTAQKVPRDLRQNLLIIADSKKILWLVPLRPSELTKVTNQTQKILQLQIFLGVLL